MSVFRSKPQEHKLLFSCWNVDLNKATTTHTSWALYCRAGRAIMALNGMLSTPP